MAKVTIPELNERAYSALDERLGNPSLRLHGVLAPCPKPGLTQVLWPYGQVLLTLATMDRSRCDEEFYMGLLALNDFLSSYLRSCQLLGLSVLRQAQEWEKKREEWEAHRGEQNWSVEIDLEAPYGEFHANLDVSIHLDSCISYLKILADLVAKTLPSVFEEKTFSSRSRNSMNSLWNEAIKRPSSAIGAVFRKTQREWFYRLSAPRREVAGIRDAQVHHGALHTHKGSWENGGLIRIVTGQWSVREQRDDSKPEEDVIKGTVHSHDLVADLGKSTQGFFSFLDHVVREAVARDPALGFTRESYSRSGHSRVFGPSDFLGSVLPVV